MTLKKLIPISLLLTALILALPAGWLNTALAVVVVLLGISSFVFEFLPQRKQGGGNQ